MTITATSGTPARHTKAILFACDASYAPYALFAAAQIARLSPGWDFDICVCSTFALDPVPSLEALGVRYCRIDTGGAFDAMGTDARRSEATYLRLALPGAFEGDYRRVLYLDSDVYIQSGDFSGLLDVPLGGHAIAAVRDNFQWRTPGRRVDSFAAMDLPVTPYFNAGVMLVDVEAFGAQRVREKAFEFARAHPAGMIHMDQDMLNGAVMGAWAELSPVWNWQYTWASRMFEAMADANVVHFIGPKKPWKPDGGEIPLRFRRAYRGFLAEHFLDAPQVGPDGVPPMANAAFLRRSLVKHLVSAGRMSAYLARFPDELTVIA